MMAGDRATDVGALMVFVGDAWTFGDAPGFAFRAIEVRPTGPGGGRVTFRPIIRALERVTDGR